MNDLESQISVDNQDDSFMTLNNNTISDININSFVYHTFVIKSISDIEDNIYLIATGIQKCLIPVNHEAELNNHLHFNYRINNEASTEDYIKERKVKTVKVLTESDNPKFKFATVTTNAMKLPLQVKMILNHFPFRLYKATVKIELTSKQISNNNSHITLRPDFVYQDKDTYQNLIRVNNNDSSAIGLKPHYDNLFDVMDKTKKFEILTPIPNIYGVAQKKDKQHTNETVEYTPIIEIGFYIYEPVLEAFFNMIAPLFMILLLMTSTILIVMDETSYLGIMCGIILAVVFVMKDIRRPTTRSKFSTTDLYIILFLLGLSVCSISVAYPLLKFIGVMISWLSNIVPIIGYFKYRDLTNKIIKNSNRYNRIIQDPEVNAKSKEDILYDNLVSVPLKEKCWGFDFKKI